MGIQSKMAARISICTLNLLNVTSKQIHIWCQFSAVTSKSVNPQFSHYQPTITNLLVIPEIIEKCWQKSLFPPLYIYMSYKSFSDLTSWPGKSVNPYFLQNQQWLVYLLLGKLLKKALIISICSLISFIEAQNRGEAGASPKFFFST